jgi:hypothetical protein
LINIKAGLVFWPAIQVLAQRFFDCLAALAKDFF